MRPLRYGMVGGGRNAFIGAVHRAAAALDQQALLTAGAGRTLRNHATQPAIMVTQLCREASRVWWIIAIIIALLAGAAPAGAQPQSETIDQALCRMIESAAP